MAYYYPTNTAPAYYSTAMQLPTAMTAPIATSAYIPGTGYNYYNSGSCYPGVYTPVAPEVANPPPPPSGGYASFPAVAQDPSNPQLISSRHHPGVFWDPNHGKIACLGPLSEETFHDPMFNTRMNKIAEWSLLRKPARLLPPTKKPAKNAKNAKK